MDAQCPDEPTVPVVVVAVVTTDDVRASSAGPAALAAYRWDGLQQRHELSDVVAVAADHSERQWDPVASVIRWCVLPGRPRSTGLGPVCPPFNALT